VSRRLPLGTSLVLALLALLACTATGEQEASAPTDSAVATTEPPKPIPPRLGACYRLTVEKATSPTNHSRSVRCSSPHDAVTIHVGRMPALDAGTGTSPRDQRRLAAHCAVELRRFTGGTVQAHRLSRLQAIWFRPSADQAAQGARWYRCDLVAVGTDDRLLRLPGGLHMRGVLGRPQALDTFGLCATAQPGARGFDRVACGVKHSWVAISTIDIPGGRTYPGADNARDAGDDTCASQVRSHQGNSLKFSYGWEIPTKAQWATGQHYGFCWAPA
jgi:hypothetical protein